MKELTIEEKAEAYDEVIQQLRSMMPNWEHLSYNGKTFLQDLIYIFPELKESEDEGIRNFLISKMKEVGNVWKEYSAKDIIAWLEKQGEQKPVEKVEPKFKVGDWVTDRVCKCQIRFIDDTQYWYSENCILGDIESIDKKYHLWTIQDAKEGDVLEFGDHGRLVVGIVSYINKSTGKVDVCCLLEDNNFKVGNYYALDTIEPHPASQEQRHLLFQKMEEAGYEWDAAKKELKKIESKPAWSEEDEDMLNRLILHFDWTGNYGFDKSDCDAARNWLKSLKERYTWKPSDEQLNALHDAAVYVDKSMFPYPKRILMKLYKQLKKLKVE